MKVEEVTSSYNAHEIEVSVQQRWHDEDTFAKVKSLHAEYGPLSLTARPIPPAIFTSVLRGRRSKTACSAITGCAGGM